VPSAPALEPEPEPPAEEEAPPLNDQGEAPPVEVERDVLQELHNMDHAVAAGGQELPEAFAPTMPGDPLAFDNTTGLSDGFYTPPRSATKSEYEPDEPRQAMKVARTLEDLCANFERLQSGEFWLRVERKSPSTHRGAPCAGWIENHYAPLTESEFQERYGGGTYVVRVQGPQANSVDVDGRYRARTFATLDNFKIAGAPRSALSDDEDMMTMTGGRRFNVHRGGIPGDAQVEMKRAELDERRQERELSRVDKLTNQLMAEKERHQNPNFFNQAAELAEARAQDIREAASEAQATLRAANSRITNQLEQTQKDLIALRDEKDAIINSLREDVFKVRQEAEQRANQQETTRIREIKENHERELKRISEDNSTKLEALNKEHARVTGDLSTRADRERADLIARFDSERRDLKETADRDRKDFIERMDRREAQFQNELRTKVETEQRSFESRMAESDRAAQREIRSVKDSYESRLQSIQALESGKSMSVQNSASMHVTLMQAELARAHAQIDEVSRENSTIRERLMEITSKDPMQAFTEAQQMVDALRGDREEPGDWKSTVGSIVKNLTDRAPDIVKEINGVREQNRNLAHQRDRQLAQAQSRPRPQQHQQAPHQQQARAHRQPPPGMQHIPNNQPPPMTVSQGAATGAAAPLGSGNAPRPTSAPLWSGNPPMDARHTAGAPPPGYADPHEHTPMTNPHPAPQVISIPPQQQPMGPPMGPPPQQHATPPPTYEPAPAGTPQLQAPPQPVQPPPPAQAAPPPSAPVEPVEPVDIPEEAFSYFTSQLDEAIKGGIIDEEMFAQEFVKRVGPDIAQRLVQTLSPDQYLGAIREGGGGGSAIATRKGQRYVQNLWTETRRQLGL
jgi:hypothetical protein